MKTNRLFYIIATLLLLMIEILIGSVFDLKDILCYAIGCTLLGVYEIMLRRNLLFQHFK